MPDLATRRTQSLPLPFDPAPSPPSPRFWRLVRETTRRAWYVVRDTLGPRERAVYFGLMAYWNRHQAWPTSAELLEFLLDLKRRHPRHPRYRLIVDVNSVRPRLSALNQRTPALVVTGPTRKCTAHATLARVDARKPAVLTWRIPQLGETPRSNPREAS